jgi:hypothetical protein
MPLYETEHRPSEAETRAETLVALRDLVKSSFDPRQIETWVHASQIRQDLSDDLVVGRIRWPRSLGRPASAELAGGFVIQPLIWADVWHITPEGVVDDLLNLLPGLPADLRDGFAEPDFYSVRYLFRAAEVGAVEVRFSDVGWRHPGRAAFPRRLYLSSHGFGFERHSQFVALPDITVASQPFFHP